MLVVLPPEASNKLNTTRDTYDENHAVIKNYAFIYKYDYRQRLSSRKMPGCAPVNMWYNNADQMICTTDADLPTDKKYRFYLYDNLGRMCIQGISSQIVDNSQPISVSTSISYPKIKDTAYGYSYPGSLHFLDSCELEIVNYYDSYDFLSRYPQLNKNGDDGNVHGLSGYSTKGINAIGNLTGTWQKTSNNEIMLSSFVYDELGNVIKTVVSGLKNHYTIMTESTYDYNGDNTNNVSTYYSFNANNDFLDTDFVIVEDYNYEYQQKKVPTTSTINIYDVKRGIQLNDTISNLKYDAYGRISQNIRGCESANMQYEYDLLSGYTKSIQTEDGSFIQHLYREEGSAKCCWNGSISSMTWEDPISSKERKYDYRYDGFNRLIESTYNETESDRPLLYTSALKKNANNLIPSQGNGSTINKYGESYTYDLNSNLTSLKRYGMLNNKTYGLIDKLIISYQDNGKGNQRVSVTDSVNTKLNYLGASEFVDNNSLENEDEYEYNEKGALIRDDNRDIDTIHYDQFGNPKKILMNNGNSINYDYNAQGLKIASTHVSKYSTQCRTYRGNVQYINDNVDIIQFPGGFFFYDYAKEAYDCYYYVQDYLQNVRLVVRRDNTIAQVNSYYPYGGIIGDISTNESLQKYKFEGKELDRTFGLDNYDIHARQYFAMAPMWDRVDPLAEKYYGISPYAYCAGDPVNCIDPDGRVIIFVNGFRLGVGCRDQVRWSGGCNSYPSVYPTDEMEYWDKKIIDYYTVQYSDDNAVFTSGSASPVSTASQREEEGIIKALDFHNKVADEKISLNGDEPIRLISHSQGGATAAGMASKLQELGYNVEIVEYITPHQPSDIKHPDGIKGIQYDQKYDRVVSGQGIINGISRDNYHVDASHFWSILGGHSNGDNLEIIKKGEQYRTQVR